MTKFLSNLGLLLYIVLGAAALLWWAPNFFAVNLHAWPPLNYRYFAATGIPLAMLAITVAARQSVTPRFSLLFAAQVLLASLLLLFGILSFNYLPQSVFFCASHLAVCAVLVLWNGFRYRRELQIQDKRQAAMRA